MPLNLSRALALAVLSAAWLLPRPASADFGDPLPGLGAADLQSFSDGKDEFEQVEDAAEGLGPIFNGKSCAECHKTPVTGGGSDTTETRFGRLVRHKFNPMTSRGGSLLQSQAVDPRVQERVPRLAKITALRQTTPLFGAGLVEAIPDSQIQLRALVEHQFQPAQEGRPNIVTSVSDHLSHVGRFGWKAPQALLIDFAADAYLNEVGVTSDLFPKENAPNGRRSLLRRFDPMPEPEDKPDPTSGLRNIDLFATFMRLLAPPPRGATQPAGEQIFRNIGCAFCHYVGYTATSPLPAINGQVVAAFSDFLLHDVGTGDGIAQGQAQPNELRTAPLWGLAAGTPYLHDGSAATIEDAILRHGNQALTAEQAFEGLSAGQHDALLTYLGSL
jgi:CxxC motif-containing protein (DUF1111 family)